MSDDLRNVVLSSTADNVTYYLLAECKRTNPSLSAWAFLDTSYSRRNESGYAFIAEGIIRTESPRHTKRQTYGIECCGSESFDHSVELKTGLKGNACAEGRGALQTAIAQVLRGVYGLSHLLRNHHESFRTDAVLLPAIITTATLYSGSFDPRAVSLDTGHVRKEDLNLHESPFLLHTYNASPAIQGEIERAGTRLVGLAPLLTSEFQRTIFIVNASHIEEFYRNLTPVARPLG